MSLHAFNTESLVPELKVPGTQGAKNAFFSHFLLDFVALRQVGRLTVLSALVCMGGVASSADATNESIPKIERGLRIEEDEGRRGQSYGSRLTYRDMAAWQQGNRNWIGNDAATEQLVDWQAVHAPSTHETLSSSASTSSIGMRSVGTSEFSESSRGHEVNEVASSRASSSSTQESSNDVLNSPLNALVGAMHSRSQSSASSVSNQSEGSEKSISSSPLTDRSEHAVSVMPGVDNFRSAASSSSVSSAQMEAKDSAIALQHSGGMHFEMPVIDETGAVVGRGSSQTAIDPSSSSRSPSTASSVASSKNSDSHTIRKTKEPVQVPVKNFAPSVTSVSTSSIGQSPAIDQQVLELRHQIKQDRRIVYGGIAAAMAMPNVTPSPGKTAVAVGGAHFQGQSAVGMGVAWRSIGGETHVNLAMGASAAAVGVRVQAAREF